MADVVLVHNDESLLHRLEPFINRLRAEGYSVETEARSTQRPDGAEDYLHDLVVIIATVALTKEYDHIKEFLREWFVESPSKIRNQSLAIRTEDEDGEVIGRFIFYRDYPLGLPGREGRDI